MIMPEDGGNLRVGEAEFLCYHAPCNHLYAHKRFIGWEACYLRCPECDPAATQALNEAAKEAASRAAAARNHCRGLQPLRGSEKQVRWAEVIRDEKFAAVEELVASCEAEYRRCAAEKFIPAPVHERWYQATGAARDLRLRTEARFWIARKDETAEALLLLAAAPPARSQG